MSNHQTHTPLIFYFLSHTHKHILSLPPITHTLPAPYSASNTLPFYLSFCTHTHTFMCSFSDIYADLSPSLPLSPHNKHTFMTHSCYTHSNQLTQTKCANIETHIFSSFKLTLSSSHTHTLPLNHTNSEKNTHSLTQY